MKNKNKVVKKLIAIMLLSCVAVLNLAGCGKQEAKSETETEEVCTDGGKVLNIYCWNTEFEERMTDYYPGYVDNGDGTGTIGDVKVVWTMNPYDDFAYQNAVDEALLLNMDAPADEKIDLFLMEADYILKYVDSDYTLDVVNDLGISESELSDQYPYTKEIATSQDGKLKGTSWQATPGLFAYRRSIALDVLGTDDPEEVQKSLSDWNRFEETAAKAAAKGYKMLSGSEDWFRVFSNNITKPWVDDPSSASPHIQIDDGLLEWADKCRKYYENGWMGSTALWSDEWAFDQSAEGKVFGFFYSTWGINFTLHQKLLSSINTSSVLSLLYKLFISLILQVFHFDISGKDDNNSQLENIKLILLVLLISHFDISGKDNNEIKSENILLISRTL